jgi:hypothetical protein
MYLAAVKMPDYAPLMRVKAGKTQELAGCHPSCSGQPTFTKASQQTRSHESGRGKALDSQAKKVSSSSRLVGAGKGAPGASWVGSRTYPSPLPKGFRDCNLERNGVVELVRTGTSGSLRDQPSEFIDSRNVRDVIFGGWG